MGSNKSASRRTFLKGGALLAAPLAAASVGAAVLADSGLKGRVARLEDTAAIRELQQSWVRSVNAGESWPQLPAQVRRIAPHPDAAADRIDIANDGASATGCFEYALELETHLAEDSTLAQMARLQGGGALRRLERGTLKVGYGKRGARWVIDTVELRMG
jgi:hypothetical protein